NRKQREPSEESEEYDSHYVDEYPHPSSIPDKMQNLQIEEELPDTTMLDSVVLPAIASVARIALSALQRAFTEAERIIPGVSLELVNEIVDS
ncbi:hypothetical protein FISHEDRAFT_24040, partial [Fistulina hepatica ATCC 64428]